MSGKKANEKGSTRCVPCDAGEAGTGENGACEQCAKGQFRSGADANPTRCRSCPIGYFQDVVGQASCLPCFPSEYQDLTGQSKCKLCQQDTASNDKSRATPCQSCAEGRTAEPGSSACSACTAGKFESSSNGGSLCAVCPEGRFTSKENENACSLCGIGETSTVGTCVKCDVGKYEANHRCVPAPVGNYQDGKGENTTKKCPKNTYGIKIGSTTLSECIQCPSDRTTGNFTGGTNATDCMCRSVDYYQDWKNDVCVGCPKGADCSTKNGVALSEIFALPGFWRKDPSMTDFVDCATIYTSTDAEDLARERCCPGGKCGMLRNQTAGTSDDQCLKGYQSVLCGACAVNYVRIGRDCEHCEQGASMISAYTSVCITAFVVSLVAGAAISRTTSSTKKESQTHNTLEAFADQSKILVSWLQILGMVTRTFNGVPWGPKFTTFASSAGTPMTLDLQFILSSLGACELALPFLAKFQVAVVVPVVIIVGIKLAEGLAIMCSRKKQSKDDRRHRREAQKNQGDKIALLVLLLVFPGVVNQAFSVFRCREVPGVIDGPYLEMDLAVRCWVGEHASYMILAGSAIAVYACGVPLLLFSLLYKHRKHLHDHTSGSHALVRHRLGGFYWHFEEHWYYWEVLVLVYKLLLTGLMCVVGHDSPYQTLLAFLISAIYAMLLLRESPCTSAVLLFLSCFFVMIEF